WGYPLGYPLGLRTGSACPSERSSDIVPPRSPLPPHVTEEARILHILLSLFSVFSAFFPPRLRASASKTLPVWPRLRRVRDRAMDRVGKGCCGPAPPSAS